MITKAKKVQFTSSDGQSWDAIEAAKVHELRLLCGGVGGDNETALTELVAKPRESIAILRLGLPRKPRTVKAKSVKSKKPAAATQPA